MMERNHLTTTNGERKSIIEQHQRNSVSEGIKKSPDGDLIILSDSVKYPI